MNNDPCVGECVPCAGHKTNEIFWRTSIFANVDCDDYRIIMIMVRWNDNMNPNSLVEFWIHEVSHRIVEVKDFIIVRNLLTVSDLNLVGKANEMSLESVTITTGGATILRTDFRNIKGIPLIKRRQSARTTFPSSLKVKKVH